mgnify:CR=1 FL=1
MTKQELAAICIARLKAEYPDSDCTLDYDHAWQLLVSVRLAAQCTDARVNVVVQELFAKYPGVKELAAADPADIEATLSPAGWATARHGIFQACMRMLHDRYDCHVPDDFNALLALPGVAARVRIDHGDVFGKPAIVTDTHCIRLCNRIGLVDNVKEPAKVERELWKIIPPAEGNGFCHRAGGPWPRRVHGPHQALLRQMLPGGRMPGTKGIFA